MKEKYQQEPLCKYGRKIIFLDWMAKEIKISYEKNLLLNFYKFSLIIR